ESPRRARGDPPRGPTRSQRAPRLPAYARFQLIDRPPIARVHDDAPRGAWTVAVPVTASSPDDRRLVRAGLADRQPTRLAGARSVPRCGWPVAPASAFASAPPDARARPGEPRLRPRS